MDGHRSRGDAPGCNMSRFQRWDLERFDDYVRIPQILKMNVDAQPLNRG